jgi:hypothetical protein
MRRPIPANLPCADYYYYFLKTLKFARKKRLLNSF